MTGKRLLIIEDDEKIAQLIGHVAMDAEFAVRTATNVAAIAPAYDQFRPHVIVLDILMPDMDGFEVLKFLHEQGSRERIVILSGQDSYRPMAAKMAKGLDLDIAATLTKPFRVAPLRKTLQEIRDTLTASEAA
jgi:two-component system, OmpR family, response regulator